MNIKGNKKKSLIIILIILGMCSFYYFGGAKYLNFEYLKENLQHLLNAFDNNPVKVLSIFGAIYLFLTSLSLPGSIILTVLSGALLGTVKGTLLVTLLGSLGASISFLLSRYLMKDYLNVKFRKQFLLINKNISKDGLLYILGVRLIPVSPFVIVNLVLGLTEVRLWTFFWTTSLGMLPGNLIYVYAGTRLREFDSLSEIMTPEFIIALTLLGCLPFLAKKLITLRRNKTIHA